MPTFNLLEATQRLMRECPRHISLSHIAKETGLVPSWLSAFSRDLIPDPGVKKVQQLYDYLVVQRPSVYGKYDIATLKETLPYNRPGDENYYVYCFYNVDVCLYVGKTCHLRGRLAGHNKARELKENNVTHVEVYLINSDAEARDFEKDRIRILKPILNSMHKEENKATVERLF